MTPSLKALLTGAVDYAGLFPPAKLPLEEAFANYLRYREDADAWMLGRFVVSASRLHELEPLLEPLAHGTAPIALSVLGSGRGDGKPVFEQLVNDLRAVREIREHFEDAITIESFELRPAEEAIRATSAENFPYGLAPIFAAIRVHHLSIYYELRIEGDPQAALRRLLEFIARSPIDPEDLPAGPKPSLELVKSITHGVKLRCGGLEAAAFPDVDVVAHVIAACRDALVPLKLTAGLHHPLHHRDEELQVDMHGFLNVFTAGVLAHRHHLDETQLAEILADEAPEHFVFDDNGFRWKDRRVNVGEIRLARQLAISSFGSCSFDEPRDDLQALGLM